MFFSTPENRLHDPTNSIVFYFLFVYYKNYKDVPQVSVIDKSEIDLRGYVDQGSTGETVHNTRHRHLPSGASLDGRKLHVHIPYL